MNDDMNNNSFIIAVVVASAIFVGAFIVAMGSCMSYTDDGISACAAASYSYLFDGGFADFLRAYIPAWML